ncbi:hypothetical protein L1887_09057 [Cichorium endivia]|nr:hypothetical protein L1887_09057 [Cichorium endivia]
MQLSLYSSFEVKKNISLVAKMNYHNVFLFSNLVIFLIFGSISGSDGGNETEYQALLQFKSIITNEALSSWNTSFHFCDWSGVSCGNRHRRVIALVLNSQGLEGSLYPYIGNLSFLRDLHLKNNSFQGTIPHELSRLSRLRVLDLGFNKFNGVIPTNLSSCSNIEKLALHDNMLVGSIPKEISFLSKLTFISLHHNNLTGGIPSVLGNITSMSTFSAADNPFGGRIPETLGQWKDLIQFYCGGCNLYGTIPHSIYNLSLLTNFSLSSNQLIGSIPSAIGSMLPGLVFFQLECIPSSLGNCHHLLELHLDSNKLSGRLPKQLLQLSSLTIALNLSQNNLFGSIPTEVGDLKMFTSLDFSNNNLSCSIPSSLGGCTSLVFLSLKGNLFQGVVPSSLSSMRGISTLDLSHNNLSGQIPQFSERFSFEYVNLSFNKFEGKVPLIGVFANVSSFSILGNSRLCGGLAELGLPKCKETGKHKKRFPLFVIVILTASTLFTILCLVYALCKKRKGRPSQALRDERFMKVSYGQLLKATNGFSQANLIGQGGFSSVYKGILDDHDDRLVALKVIHLQTRGAQKSFIAECEMWRSIRHRNLVKIITSCSSVDFHGNDFKELVYEFMPNGSLYDWLYSSATASGPNLLQRINILIDVAFALEYLHNHCLPIIVHCDLKPNNILLDDDMVAHVGDFGLARFLGTNSNQNSTSGIRGTIGYAPPEYGVGSDMTSSGDVYSFGILLLEVITGKKPTDHIFNEGLSLYKFAHMALPNHVTNVIDDDLLNFLQEDAIGTQRSIANTKKIEECLASTVKIGVSCFVDSPSQRMNIKNVVQELQHILDILENI